MASPAWLAVSAHAPADSMVTVLPLIVHTAGEVLAITNGLVEAPGVAETVKVPLAAYTGAVGLAAKFVIVWLARPMTTLSAACGAAL